MPMAMPLKTPSCLGFYAVVSHDPRHSVSPAREPLAVELLVNPRIPISFSLLLVNPNDMMEQRFVVDCLDTLRLVSPRVIASPRNA